MEIFCKNQLDPKHAAWIAGTTISSLGTHAYLSNRARSSLWLRVRRGTFERWRHRSGLWWMVSNVFLIRTDDESRCIRSIRRIWSVSVHQWRHRCNRPSSPTLCTDRGSLSSSVSSMTAARCSLFEWSTTVSVLSPDAIQMCVLTEQKPEHCEGSMQMSVSFGGQFTWVNAVMDWHYVEYTPGASRRQW